MMIVSAAGCVAQPPAGAAAAGLNEAARTVEPESTLVLPPEAVDWTERGVRFDGPWRQSEIEMVTAVLDRFTDRLGEERFLVLIRKAVRTGTDGDRQTLVFQRDVEVDDRVGTWAFHEGRITLYNGLFDPEHLADHYALRFEHHLEAVPSGPVSSPMFTVAHELGHALLEGLRQERTDEGLAPTVLEDLYAERIDLDVRVHPFHPVKENVVSEIALWVFEVHRPPVVREFNNRTLEPALLGE
jgi:hypothetical protein